MHNASDAGCHAWKYKEDLHNSVEAWSRLVVKGMQSCRPVTASKTTVPGLPSSPLIDIYRGAYNLGRFI